MKRDRLERRLQRATGRRIRLVVTNNRRRVLTYTPKADGHDTLRLSRIFLGADESVHRALTKFLRGDAEAQQVLQTYADRKAEQLTRTLSRTAPDVRHRGDAYDLGEIFDRLNERYFNGRIDVWITWGRRRRPGPKRSIQLGTYCGAERLIRINPVLDDERVPQFVLAKIVFHEMLHHVVRPKQVGKRRSLHSSEFLTLESLFPRAEEAEQWIQKHLSLILGGKQQASLKTAQ